MKKIMFHKMQNKKWCFRNGLLRKTKTFMFTKTQNLNNEKQRQEKGIGETTKQETRKKTEIIDEKKPFTSNILMLFVVMKQKQRNKARKNSKKTRKVTKKTKEQGRTKKRNQRNRERERERETESEKEK